MANDQATPVKNSSTKSVIFVATLAACLCIAGVVWVYFPRNENHSEMEVIDGKFVLSELGLVFVYNPEVLAWPKAHEACRQLQGHLAFPHSLAEAKGMEEVMKNNSVEEVHAGFHDLFVEKEYVTVLGESLEEVGYQVKMANWAHGPDSNCGKFANNKLITMKCSEMLPSICRLSTWHDYDLLTGFGYYKLHENATTWPTAWATCRQEGSYLLVLRSEAELQAMLQMMANSSTVTHDVVLHYGVHQLFSENRTTIFDEPMESAGYNAWDNSRAASGSDDENLSFASLHLRPSALPSKQAGGLSMARRSNVSLPFICKHDLHH